MKRNWPHKKAEDGELFRYLRKAGGLWGRGEVILPHTKFKRTVNNMFVSQDIFLA